VQEIKYFVAFVSAKQHSDT